MSLRTSHPVAAHTHPPPRGAAVFWDQRIPHANARTNAASEPRRVIYGGFLPRVPLNERYAAEQLRRYELGLPQPDFWLEEDSSPGPAPEPPAPLAKLPEHAQRLLM